MRAIRRAVLVPIRRAIEFAYHRTHWRTQFRTILNAYTNGYSDGYSDGRADAYSGVIGYPRRTRTDARPSAYAEAHAAANRHGGLNANHRPN